MLTVGTPLWYHPVKGVPGFDGSAAPFAAIVTHIWAGPDAGTVNLTVFNRNGEVFGRSTVPFIEQGTAAPSGEYAEWPHA